MCGRYALGIRAAFVRHQLQQQGLPVNDAPADDEARETYNFPPGSYGLVYRAEIPDQGVQADDEASSAARDGEAELAPSQPSSYNYQIKVMKWGLIPFWTKRSPDYGSMMRTINCRDDSLLEDRGMWTSMKRKKRCLVIAQGFYEWLKKGPGGKEKIPHFIKRKDGNLMCFAGLWDCVRYEDADEKLYTYTIITTDSNKQLRFLHDRMPVILDPGTDAMKTWLDPTRTKWSRELQSLLKPFEGELECYPVSKEVGKVGNNSPDFIVPIDSKDNKKNIANFFGNAKAKNTQPEKEPEEDRITNDHEGSEDNAPLPVPPTTDEPQGQKRKAEDEVELESKVPKLDDSPKKTTSPIKESTRTKAPSTPKAATGKTARSATNNVDSILKSASPNKKGEKGNQRITNFFVK